MAWQKEKKKGNNRRVAFDDDEFYVVGQILADSIYPPSYIYIYIYREAFRGEARENVSEMRFDSRSNGLTKRGWGSWGYMNVLDSLVGGDRLGGSVNHRYLSIFVILLGVWGMIGGRVINSVDFGKILQDFTVKYGKSIRNLWLKNVDLGMISYLEYLELDFLRIRKRSSLLVLVLLLLDDSFVKF